jgi:hypothetical protein
MGEVRARISRVYYSQAAQAAEVSYPILSDLLNYTLNLKFVNVAFSLRADSTFYPSVSGVKTPPG